MLINVVVAAKMGSESLGVFNQIYALYIIAAQIAVMAVHDSTQKHIAQYHADEEKRRVLSVAGVIHTALSGFAIALVVYIISPLVGYILDSDATALGIALTTPGICLYAVNKVLMGVLNGRRKMRLYAVGQGLRAAGLLGVCLFVALTELPAAYLGLSFTVTEVCLFPYLLIVAAPARRYWAYDAKLKSWIKIHFNFGSKALVNALLADAHIRISIIVLGIFLSDSEVGIYSFASMFMEGMFQISVVTRTISNPVLVKLLTPLDRRNLSRFVRRIAGLSFAVTTLGIFVLIIIFPYFSIIFDVIMIEKCMPILTILGIGMAISSIFVPTDHAFLQAGRPGAQSIMMCTSIILNIILNVTLISLYGLMGAAIATALAFVASGVVQNVMAWKILGIKGGFIFAK